MDKNYLVLSITDENLEEILIQVMNEDFQLSIYRVKLSVKKLITEHIKRFSKDTKVVIERNYVDKVYRDSYYAYYASKRTGHQRNTIKLSFFSDVKNSITIASFLDKEQIDYLRDSYRGFIILRPTSPNIVGRSAIAPNLLDEHNFKVCLTRIPSSVVGLKVESYAFPFSSQDTGTISCAETTVWALMEYFANKYPEYSPMLPSKILSLLRTASTERQLPSSGLSIASISYLLKECGFGPKLYSYDEFKDDFFPLLSCYIESGIPIIVAIDNAKAVEDNKVNIRKGHAVLCIGHENVTESIINETKFLEYPLKNGSGSIRIKDLDNVTKKFIFIDDNFPAYQLDSLGEPINRYLGIDDAWKFCAISHFIVPLHKKNYLEAFFAKKFVKELLTSQFCYYKDGKDICIRTFLCSARSYREYVLLSNMHNELKTNILNKSFPKFIWVTEISNNITKLGEASGLILLDATEANIEDFSPLIIAMYAGYIVQYDKDSKSIVSTPSKGCIFNIFDNNLKQL